MENCLVTKLKSVVDNSNLNVLGRLNGETYLRVETPNTGYVFISAATSNTVKITVLDENVYVTQVGVGGTLIDGKTCLLGNKDVTYPGFSVTPKTQKVKVYVDNKYELSDIVLDQGSNIDIKELKYTKIESFKNYGITKGHISDFPSTLVSLSLYGGIDNPVTTEEFLKFNLQRAVLNTLSRNLTGDFINFAHMTSAVSFNLTGTSVTGSLNAFIRKQIENGRSSCDKLNIGYNVGRCTFNDIDHSREYFDKYLKWDNTKMYLCKTADDTVIDEDTI